MRLVDHEQPDIGLPHLVKKPRGGEALGRDVEELEPAGDGAVDGGLVGIAVLLRVHERHPVAQPACTQRLHLVLHQRHERRHHHRQVVTQKRRQLVAEGLARARRHHDHHVAVGQRRLARLPLPRPEAGEAEVLVESGGEVHREGHSNAASGGRTGPELSRYAGTELFTTGSSSRAYLPFAESVRSSGYSPEKQASQWVSRVERIASYTLSKER